MFLTAMRCLATSIILLGLWSAGSLIAQQAPVSDLNKRQEKNRKKRTFSKKDKGFKPFKAKAEVAHAFSANFRSNEKKRGSSTSFNFGVSTGMPLQKKVFLRFGIEGNQHAFSFSEAISLPQNLTSLSGMVTLNWMPAKKWGVMVQARPGFFGDGDANLGFSHLKISGLVALSYKQTEDWEWFFGVIMNSWGHSSLFPDINFLMPVAGFTWKFADSWKLELSQNVRLSFEATPNLTLYGGGDFKSGTYRLSENFGSKHNFSRMNNALLNYRQIRVGMGLKYKLTEVLDIGLESGAVLFHEFSFTRFDRELRLEASPYVQLSGTFKF